MKFNWLEKKVLFWIIFILLLGGLLWYVWGSLSFRSTETVQQQNFNPGTLRAQAKIVVWEQDYQVSDVMIQKSSYLKGMMKFEEKVSTSANGKMGFDFDLADSINTLIEDHGSYVLVSTRLELTYNQIDMGSIKQVKDASYDPTLEINLDSCKARLSQKALETYVPIMLQTVLQKGLSEQERNLAKLVGKPVKLQCAFKNPLTRIESKLQGLLAAWVICPAVFLFKKTSQ